MRNIGSDRGPSIVFESIDINAAEALGDINAAEALGKIDIDDLGHKEDRVSLSFSKEGDEGFN